MKNYKVGKTMVSINFAVAVNLAVAPFALLSKRKKHPTTSWHCVVA